MASMLRNWPRLPRCLASDLQQIAYKKAARDGRLLRDRLITESPAVSAAPTTATATGAGFSHVDPDHSAHPLHVLEIVDGLLLVSSVSHLNESEPTLTAGIAIERQAALANRAVLGEQALKVLHFGIEGEVAHVNGHEMN